MLSRSLNAHATLPRKHAQLRYSSHCHHPTGYIMILPSLAPAFRLLLTPSQYDQSLLELVCMEGFTMGIVLSYYTNRPTPSAARSHTTRDPTIRGVVRPTVLQVGEHSLTVKGGQCPYRTSPYCPHVIAKNEREWDHCWAPTCAGSGHSHQSANPRIHLCNSETLQTLLIMCQVNQSSFNCRNIALCDIPVIELGIFCC